MASSIFQGQISKDTDQTRAQDYNKGLKERTLFRPVDVSRIVKDKVVLRNGEVKVINPAKIASIVGYMLDDIRDNKYYSFIVPFIKKPIIWTYEIKTACTDGIRIYMSPLFAHTLLAYGAGKKSEAAEFWNTLSSTERLNQDNVDKYNAMYTKYVRFTVVHECYHILYNHVRRSILKYGSSPAYADSQLGNISMDLEINRDIESTFPDLAGSTEVINGIWFQNPKYYSADGKVFKNDIWEEVWDDWKEHKKSFKSSNPFNDEGVNPKQKSSAQAGPYADGWRKAIEAIKKKQINPRTVQF